MKKYQAYGLSLLAGSLGFAAWGQGLRWHFSHLSTYKLFPLFGLLAYGLLWSTYMVSWAKRHQNIGNRLDQYYKNVRLLIIIFIVAHPSLLIWQLWRDGFGLPPGSYLQHYVAPSLKWASVLSSVAFFVFVAYEFKWKYGKTSWWQYVEYAGDAAMIAIFIHALKLGSNLQHGWFRAVWFIYGLTLLISLVDLYWLKYQRYQLRIAQ